MEKEDLRKDNRTANMTRKDLADYLQRSPRSVDRLIKLGKGPRGHKLNGTWLFRRVEVDQWLEQFRVGEK